MKTADEYIPINLSFNFERNNFETIFNGQFLKLEPNMKMVTIIYSHPIDKEMHVINLKPISASNLIHENMESDPSVDAFLKKSSITSIKEEPCDLDNTNPEISCVNQFDTKLEITNDSYCSVDDIKTDFDDVDYVPSIKIKEEPIDWTYENENQQSKNEKYESNFNFEDGDEIDNGTFENYEVKAEIVENGVDPGEDTSSFGVQENVSDTTSANGDSKLSRLWLNDDDNYPPTVLILLNSTKNGEGFFECGHCTFKALIKQSLIDHFISVHRAVFPRYVFRKSENSLKSQIDGQSENEGPQKPPYACQVCKNSKTNDSFVSFDMGVLLEHALTEHNSQFVACAYCEYITKSPASLSLHLRHIHPDKKEFNCETCGELFDKLSAKRKHEEHEHGETRYNPQNRIKCPHCSSLFTFKVFLDHHINSFHKYTCDLCGNKFSLKRELKKHKHTAHGIYYEGGQTFEYAVNLPNLCKICNVCFKTSSSLKYHIGDQHNKTHTFHCRRCTYRYLDEKGLVEHEELVHVFEKEMYCCQYCSYKCSTRTDFDHHKNIHKEVRHFKCNHCDFKSSFGKDLKKHKKELKHNY